MIRVLARQAVLVAAAALACDRLADQYGVPDAAVIWAIGSAAGCALGATLLRTSRVGRITWKNRLAGYLIPWGWRLNGGRLWPAAAVSWVVWMAVGGTVWLLRADGGVSPWWGTVGRWLLAAAWAVDAAALLYVLGTIRQATPGARLGAMWRLVGAIAVLIIASVTLVLSGLPTLALAVAGGPPLVVGGAFGLFLAAVMTVERNGRWN